LLPPEPPSVAVEEPPESSAAAIDEAPERPTETTDPSSAAAAEPEVSVPASGEENTEHTEAES
jgi:hypothetical protein